MEHPAYHLWRKAFIAERGRSPTAYEAWVEATQRATASPTAHEAQKN